MLSKVTRQDRGVKATTRSRQRRALSVLAVVTLMGLRIGSAAARPAAAAFAVAPMPAAVDCPENRLLNASFEHGFSTRQRLVEVVASGWRSWYESLPGVDGINYAPEYRPRFRYRVAGPQVLHGLWSQEMATEDATHIGGVWQQAAVPPGSQVLARVWAYGWATSGQDELVSRPPGTYALLMGIDPLGGDDPHAARIQWTSPVTLTDAWIPLVLDVPVEGPVITLFLRGQALVRLRHNVSRWDAACLRVLGPAGEPTASPTPAPWPTRTPAPGTPTADADIPTPDAAMTRAWLEVGLAATATARAASDNPQRGAGSVPTLAVAAARRIPAGAAASGAQRDEGVGAALGRRLAAQSGVVFLALATFVAGLTFALARDGR